MAVIRGRISSWSAKPPADHWGQIMKRLTRTQLFASAKRARRNKDWFERAKLVVAAARDRAVETAQQRKAPSMKRFPTVLQRRRLAFRRTQAKRPYSCRQLLANATIAASRRLEVWCTAAPERQYLASLRSGLWDLLANDYAATYLDASFVDAISARR